MREIKFRAWDGKMMHHVDTIAFPVGGTRWWGPGAGSGICEANPKYDFKVDSVLMQFTGLLDKSGKEIWEGDIVYENYFGLEIIGEIVYTHYSVGIKGFVKEHTGEWSPWEADDTFKFGAKYHEVIGNVYENPELLKEKLS